MIFQILSLIQHRSHQGYKFFPDFKESIPFDGSAFNASQLISLIEVGIAGKFNQNLIESDTIR